MPPGVPVACVGVDNARNAAVLAARILDTQMIERYTRPEIGAVWTDEARLGAWRDVEVAAAEELDGPTRGDLEAIRAATFTVEAINEREKITDHDIAAFVDVLGASAGAGRALDPLRADVLRRARHRRSRCSCGARARCSCPGARALAAALADAAREHADTLCVGRTHGVHAEPTSFGLKLAGFAFEAHRNAERLERAFAQAATGAISGAVGTYATLGPDYEARVLERLGLAAEPVSTQVVPRDRHAELLQAIALAGAGLERFATEIRHLQRTEVREVEEPFRAGQKGSSAMPHKRNPIIDRADLRPRARAARQRAGGARERRALARARHLALRRRADHPARRDDRCSTTCSALALRVVRGHDRPRRPDAREPRAHLRRAVLPARAAGAGRGRDAARRRLPDRAAARPAGVGHPDAAAHAARARGRRRASTSTRSSTTATTRASCPRCWRGWR